MKLTFLFILTSISVLGQTDIEKALFDLPDINFVRIESIDGFEACFQLNVKQPLDHNDHAKGYFYQRIFLSHRGFDHPNVIVTEGYARHSNRIYEVTELLNANQLDVEHRYFGRSKPDSLDWDYLNLRQACADLHRIRELLGSLYSNHWVSTGISKGGATSIFYKYLYPDDVSASVPYVAPINREFEDKRIYHFLDTVGTDECRQALLEAQYRILEARETVLPQLKWYCKGAGLEFTYLNFEEAFEYTVLEYPFAFWQWGADCSDIPPSSSTLEELVDHMLEVSDIGFFSDRDMNDLQAHYYQSAEEMGYYGYETKDFKGLLQALPMRPNPHAAFTPNKMEVEFDDTLLKEINKWLKNEGDRFVYIYGGSDTWTATGVPFNSKVDSRWIIMPGTDHGKARIRNMNQGEMEVLVSALEGWLQIKREDMNTAAFE